MEACSRPCPGPGGGLDRGWEAFLGWTTPGWIDPTLRGAVRQRALVNVAVTLGFAPEDCDILLFQGYGVVSGAQESRILLNRVRPEEVRRITPPS